jgi:fructose/tagatose bisphosphate aldolase
MPVSIDELVYQVHFGFPNEQLSAFAEIRDRAEQQGTRPASIHPLYVARGRGYVPPSFTVPAFNLRGLSYLTAQAALEAALELQTGTVIFELARSEMKYTGQTPMQVAASVLGAAVKVGYRYPVFIQGDHYQPKAEQPGLAQPGELDSIEQLIRDSIAAGFYNIDLDGSTLVNSDLPTEYDQQRPNFLYTAQMAKLVRSLQPEGTTISLGCEISEVGTHLSKSSQLAAFMSGLHEEGHFDQLSSDWQGFSKVAIETGTKHGGTTNSDGSPGGMAVDFERIKNISMLARRKYQMAGAVQHGASTLTKALFTRFPEYETAEIHLSTGFQNTIMNHPAFPQQLIDQMYRWCDMNCMSERKPNLTAAQFYAKTRKKAWGPFKEQTWTLPTANLQAIKAALKQECRMYYQSLNVTNTIHLVKEWV